MTSRKVRNRSGVSLLEVLVATMVLLVAMAALTSQALVGARAARRANLQITASTICQSLLEEHMATNILRNSPARPVQGFDGWMAQTKVEALNDAATTFDLSRKEQLCLISVTAWRIGSDERLSRLTLSQVARFPAELTPTKLTFARVGEEP